MYRVSNIFACALSTKMSIVNFFVKAGSVSLISLTCILIQQRPYNHDHVHICNNHLKFEVESMRTHQKNTTLSYI